MRNHIGSCSSSTRPARVPIGFKTARLLAGARYLLLLLLIGFAASAWAAPAITGFTPANGPIYTPVTVTGTGFSATASTVRFNGQLAAIASATTTQLVVAVPSGATSGAITVDVGKFSASSATSFAVTAFTYDGSQWLNPCQVTDPKIQTVLKSEGFLVNLAVISGPSGGFYQIAHEHYTQGVLSQFVGPPIILPLSPSSLFYDEFHLPGTTGRSAVLIGPDLVLTAPHQSPFPISSFAVVFDLAPKMVGGVCQFPDFDHVPAANVFFFDPTRSPIYAVSTYHPAGEDYLAFYLTQSPNRPFVRLRRSGVPYSGDAAAEIGHPERLTTKISPAGQLFGITTGVGPGSGRLLINGTHNYEGNSGSMIYNLNHDYVEAAVAPDSSCATYQPVGSVYATVLACPPAPYISNVPVGAVADAAGIPSYSLVTSPQGDVTHVAAVGGTATSPTTAYTLAAPSNLLTNTQWQIVAPTGQSPNAPAITFSPTTASGTLSPGGSYAFSATVGTGSVCGKYDETIKVQDLTHGFTDSLTHHFEIGLTEFSVTPSQTAVLQKIVPPYTTVQQSYLLTNPRPTSVTITVQSPALMNLSVQQGAVTTNPAPSPVSVTLGPAGSGTATASVIVSPEEGAAEALPALTQSNSTITFTNSATSCVVTAAIARSVQFTRGKQEFDRIDTSIPEIPHPLSGTGYGAPVVETIAIADNFVIDSIAVDTGIYDFPQTFMQTDFNYLKVVLVSPAGAHFTLWDSNGTPTGGYYSQVYIPEIVDNSGELHIDDQSLPSPVVGTNLSTLHGQSGQGTWSIEVYGKQNQNALFVNWGLRFTGHLPSWTAEASMATGRVSHTESLLSNGKVLIAGGFNNGTNAVFASTELYTPSTNTWSAGGSLTYARDYHTATVLGSGNVLAVGGFNNTNGVLTATELYDPSTNAWSAAATASVARQGHTATRLSSGKVLVVGGSSSSVIAELYDPSTNTWSSAGTPSTARYFHSATLLPNGKVLISGGRNSVSSTLTNVDLYDPSTNSWSTAASMANARYLHTTTMLPSGLVLASGGYGVAGNIASTELYNPTTNTWSAGGNLSFARSQHTATLLPSGKVLIAGGGVPTYRNNEMYDPATNTASVDSAFITGRVGHTATLLPAGTVLAVGGAGPLASAEIH